MPIVQHLQVHKAAAIALLASGLMLSQSALALKCYVYMSLDGGEFMCAGWRAETPCEENPKRCVPPPTPPDPPPNSPGTTPGIPPGGPYSGNQGTNDPPSPEKMTCEQLKKEDIRQDRNLKKIIDAIRFVNDELDTARRNLGGPLSQALIDQVKMEADYKCNTWNGMIEDKPLRVCTERNGHEICKNRALSTSEKIAFNSCNTTMARYTSLSQARWKAIDLETKDMAMYKSLEQSKQAIVDYMKALQDAKDNKNCGRQ